MLTAAEIEEWNLPGEYEVRQSYKRVVERAVKAERERDELMRVLQCFVVAEPWQYPEALAIARAAIAKIEGEK